MIINTPIDYDLRRTPGKWRFDEESGNLVCVAEIGEFLPLSGKLEDVWTQFLEVPTGDVPALLGFLNRNGRWSQGDRYKPEEFWQEQEDIRRIVRAKRKTPKVKQLIARKLRGVLDSGPREIVPQGLSMFQIRVQTTLAVIRIGVYVELAKGAKYGLCARKDCPRYERPFKLNSSHPGKYCSRECQHLELVRRDRDNEKKAMELFDDGHSVQSVKDHLGVKLDAALRYHNNWKKKSKRGKHAKKTKKA